MKLKNVMLILIAILSLNIVNAQKIKLKKGKVLFDNIQVLNYEQIDMNTIIISSLEDIELMHISRHDNETQGIDDDFVKIYFMKSKMKLESNSVGRRSWKYYISWLIKNKVLSKEGILNEENINSLVERYDEKITDRTIRNN